MEAMEKSSENEGHELCLLIDSRIDHLKQEILSYNEKSKFPDSLSSEQENPMKKLQELYHKLDRSALILKEFANPLGVSTPHPTDKNPNHLFQKLEKEKNECNHATFKCEDNHKEMNQTFLKIKNEAREVIKKNESEYKALKIEYEKLEKSNKKQRKEYDEKLKELAKEVASKNKEINDLTIENEALATQIGKLIQEKTKIFEAQQRNEEKYERIIKALEEEKQINREKCATLHKNYNLIHDHSNVKIHKCEKEIELKITQIHQLNEQVNILSQKMQEENDKKCDLNEEKEALLESKNQEILNLKIDLNKMESKIQSQSEEMMKLERTHSIKMEGFDVVLEEKENEIFKLKKELKETEEQLNEERRKIQSVYEGSSPMLSSPEDKEDAPKAEKDSEMIACLEAENDKLKKELRIVKKSLKETLDLNDVFSRDLQKMKHKSNKMNELSISRIFVFSDMLEIKQKDQEIFKYRQMLERLDRIDTQNKLTQEVSDQKKNHSFGSRSFGKESEMNGAFLNHKSVFSDEKSNRFEGIFTETVEAKTFPEDVKLNRDQELCKGCSIF